MNWFTQLTGIIEKTPKQVRSQLELNGKLLTSTVNGNSWYYGDFSAPMLHDLRNELEYKLEQEGKYNQPAKMQLREIVADITKLHTDPSNAGALFQVASQFNMLEMASPNITPEQGVGIYDRDITQGPACAIACGAATIWRNYFMPLKGQTGQTTKLQFDALNQLSSELYNNNDLWRLVNGYVQATRMGLERMTSLLTSANSNVRYSLSGLVRIGVQSDTQVTLPGCQHRVKQVFCSALPVAYSTYPAAQWEQFARFILDAAYEATLFVAMQNLKDNQQNKVYLTLLGGGAFGNKQEWILDSLRSALLKFSALPLDVNIVSHQQSNPAVRQLVDELKSQFEPQTENITTHKAKSQMTNPNPIKEEEPEQPSLKQVVDAYRSLQELLEQGDELLQCPTCEQPYTSHGMPLELIKVLERIQFMSTYNLKEDEGKVAMPICYDCQTRVVNKYPVGMDDDYLDMPINGYKIYRRGSMHWVHV